MVALVPAKTSWVVDNHLFLHGREQTNKQTNKKNKQNNNNNMLLLLLLLCVAAADVVDDEKNFLQIPKLD